MLLFSNAKINLGLRVLSKRPDGYHNIETVMLPVGLSDMLEFVENSGTQTRFSNTGIDIGCTIEDNLVFKAFNLIRKDYQIPHLNIHLHKFIPHGAGLGGGSSNAAFMLKGLNDYFHLGLDIGKLENYAAILGSDCPFFIRNTTCLASGIGEVLNEITLPGTFFMVLLYPGFPVSTRVAYNGINPWENGVSLISLLNEDPENWRNIIINDFESTVFLRHRTLANIKESLYEQGAIYASMTGSGSAMYGLFREKPDLTEKTREMLIWEGKVGK